MVKILGQLRSESLHEGTWAVIAEPGNEGDVAFLLPGICGREGHALSAEKLSFDERHVQRVCGDVQQAKVFCTDAVDIRDL